MSTSIVDRCDFRPGEMIGNRYVVCKTLGEGSFGMVYLVADQTRSQYALKLLRLWEVPSDIRQPLVDRFEMEYKTGQIDCENLVRSLDYGMTGGNPYIVMEYCAGGDLTPYLGNHTEQVPRICGQILTGLNALHREGKVHRDLKPENVLFKQNGVAALTDFGISGDRNNRMTQRNIFGKPNQIFGTYAYMPPEQAARMRGGATVLPTTDIFSFGVLVFQLLTGHLPFGSLENHNDLAEYQRRSKNGEWNRRQLLSLPEGRLWEKLISGCLTPDYRERLQSVGEVYELIPKSNWQHRGAARQPVYQQLQARHQPVAANVGVPPFAIQWGLRVMQGLDYGKTYPLTQLFRQRGRILTVGRSQENTIVIMADLHSNISRCHCTIEVSADGGQFMVRDGQWQKSTRLWRDSANGTYVNSRPIGKAGWYLKEGDIITIGDTTLKFYSYSS